MMMDPLAPWRLSLQAAQIGVEAHSIIAMRLAGMAGFWATPPEELTRMVSEKAIAAIEVAEATTRAAIAGESADRVMEAGLRQIGRHTARNMRRLSKMGPAMGPVFW